MMFPQTIALSQSELAYCVDVGKRRQLASGWLPPAHGLARRGDPLERHIEGAKAEYAVHRVTGEPWTPVVDDYRTLRGADVGPYGVRSTKLRNGCLILHPDDSQRVFILVVSSEPLFTLVGCLWASEGQHERFWRDDVPSAAFFVPQSRLRQLLPELSTVEACRPDRVIGSSSQ